MKRRLIKIDISGKIEKREYLRKDKIDCKNKNNKTSENYSAASEDLSAVIVDSRAEPINEAVKYY